MRGGSTAGYIAPRQLCHSDNLQAIDVCALDTSIYEADRKAPIPQPICLIAFKRGIRLPSFPCPVSLAQFPCPVPSPKATFSTCNSSSYRVACFFTGEEEALGGGLKMGGVPGGILPPTASGLNLPARASLLGVRSLSLVLTDFGTLLFLFLVVIFILLSGWFGLP